MATFRTWGCKMAYFPHVTPSDPFTPSAMLSNSVRDLINGLNGMSGGAYSRGASCVVRLPVHNYTDFVMAGGASVSPVSGTMCGDAIPVGIASPGSDVWAILASPLNPGGVGDAIFCGGVAVYASGAQDSYIAPDGEGGLVYSSSGAARVIFSSGNFAVMVIGVGGSAGYAGPFKIAYANGLLSVPGGYVLANGAIMSVGAATVSPATGYLCIYAQLSEAGAWSYGYNIQTYPATDGSTAVYPLAYINVPTGGGTPVITQFYHSLPQLWVLGTC